MLRQALSSQLLDSMARWIIFIVIVAHICVEDASHVGQDHCAFCRSSFDAMRRAAKEKVKEGLRQAPPTSRERQFDFLEPQVVCDLDSRDGYGDGPKWICGLNLIRPPCLLFSLGSKCQFDFEDAVRKLPGSSQCDLHIYDPFVSCDGTKIAKEKYNATFHYEGVGNVTRMEKVEEKSYQFRTFRDIMKNLSYTGRTIDILKMDIEKSEYAVFESTIFRDLMRGDLKINQIQIELHSHPFSDIQAFARRMHEAGFYLFHKERNGWGCSGFSCVEFSFISTEWMATVYHATHCPYCPPLPATASDSLHQKIQNHRLSHHL